MEGGDRRNALRLEVVGQVLASAEVASKHRQVADHQSRGKDLGGFNVFRVDADVADVWIRQGDDLPAIRGVGKDFLVAGDRGVEHDLTGGVGQRTDGNAPEYRAVR